MAKGKGLGAHKVKPRTETVRICTDGEVTGRIRELDAELAKAERDDREQNRTPQAAKLSREIRDLEEAAEAATVNITLRGLGDTAWRKLIAEHPPTKKQIADAKAEGQRKPDHDVDVFPYAAVAASIVKIDGEAVEETEETVRDFFEPLPGEWARVWTVALAVNVGGNDVPFSQRASRHLTGSEESSQSAEPMGSVTAIS